MSKVLHQICNLFQTQLNITKNVSLSLSRSYHRTPARKVRKKLIPTVNLPVGLPVELPQKYTTKPLPYRKLAGRNNEGHVVVVSRGGGHKKNFRMVDIVRIDPEDKETVLEERVEKILYDPIRSGRLALVASGTHKRYVLASENMKEGDLITSSRKSGKIEKVQEGDARPLRVIAIGTMVHNIEKFPGQGGKYCRAAGTCAQLIRKKQDSCILLLPSKREIEINTECLAVVGRVSNPEHQDKHIGGPNRLRWLGFRPRSGKKSIKGGYDGKKIKKLKPITMLEGKKTEPPQYYMTQKGDEAVL